MGKSNNPISNKLILRYIMQICKNFVSLKTGTVSQKEALFSDSPTIMRKLDEAEGDRQLDLLVLFLVSVSILLGFDSTQI